MTFLRSAIFFLWFALVSAAICIVFLPALILPRKVTVWMSRQWSALNFWGLRVIAGVRFEVRGRMPKNGVLVAAKHMSMWDTMALYLVLDDPAVVLKRGLQFIPFYGWYITKAGSIAIDRSGKGSAVRKMLASARRALAQGRSILIFPEGTRKKPDAPPDYKPGVAALYNQLGVECVPAALNSGLFWTGFIKHPGNIVLEFLEPIPPGLRSRDFMKVLQERVETATARLVAEGWPSPTRSAREVAKYLRDFIEDTGDDWDWDDFTSVPIKYAPALEEIRDEADRIPLPINASGMTKLRDLLQRAERLCDEEK